jgi:hypothetical protein
MTILTVLEVLFTVAIALTATAVGAVMMRNPGQRRIFGWFLALFWVGAIVVIVLLVQR